MNSHIKVIKSDGSKVDINLDKIHRMVEKACKGITGVSESLVEMNSGIQFYDGISTGDIQKILVKSASDLITLENPNYQFVAARLLLFGIQKQKKISDLKILHSFAVEQNTIKFKNNTKLYLSYQNWKKLINMHF